MTTVGSYVKQVMADLESAKAPGVDVIQIDKAPTWYSGLLGVAAGHRKVIASDALEQQLWAAQDVLTKKAPEPGLLQKLGIRQPSANAQAKTRKTRALADELLTLMQLEGGARYAQAVKLGAAGLK